MLQHPTDPAFTDVMLFLIEEVKAARSRSLSVENELELIQVIRRRERFTRRLGRVVVALENLDEKAG